MPPFPHTGTPTTPETTTAAAVWIERINSEYRRLLIRMMAGAPSTGRSVGWNVWAHG
jgi:hypothetical protein